MTVKKSKNDGHTEEQLAGQRARERYLSDKI